jgi:tetratricopeptide (TPR) repeat protein
MSKLLESKIRQLVVACWGGLPLGWTLTGEWLQRRRRNFISAVCAGSFVLFCLCVPEAALSQGADVAKLFQSANRLYSEGNFKAAVEQYRKIAEANFANEAVYYNLANAYFKQNQIGPSILYYEKAKRLAPGDREISENLDLARTRIVDKVESPQEGFLWRQAIRLANWLPLNVETGLAVVLFVGANGLFTLFLKARSERLRRVALAGTAGLFALFLLVGSSNAFRIYQSITDLEAVVLAEKADVLSGPGGDSPTLFSIHEGLKVKVQSQLNDWSQISLENGWTGWIRAGDLGMI